MRSTLRFWGGLVAFVVALIVVEIWITRAECNTHYAQARTAADSFAVALYRPLYNGPTCGPRR